MGNIFVTPSYDCFCYVAFFGRCVRWVSLCKSLDSPNLPLTRNKTLLSKKGLILYRLLNLLISTLLSEFAFRTLTSPWNEFSLAILIIVFAAFSKSSTFISFSRLSEVGFLICFVKISFASMTHAIIFFIFNQLVVSKPILKMMASLVIGKLTLTSFFNSGSSLLRGVGSPSQTSYFC